MYSSNFSMHKIVFQNHGHLCFMFSLALLFVLVFFSHFSIAITSLGEKRAGLCVSRASVCLPWKSCSFCLPRVPFVNCRQFMYLVISLLDLRAGYGIWLYQFLIIAYLFTLHTLVFVLFLLVSGVGCGLLFGTPWTFPLLTYFLYQLIVILQNLEAENVPIYVFWVQELYLSDCFNFLQRFSGPQYHF